MGLIGVKWDKGYFRDVLEQRLVKVSSKDWTTIGSLALQHGGADGGRMSQQNKPVYLLTWHRHASKAGSSMRNQGPCAAQRK